MDSFGRFMGKKAAKATWRHSVHGMASKARRQPLRSGTLLGVGIGVGAAAGFLAAKLTNSSSSSSD
jgi:hypothetical protein